MKYIRLDYAGFILFNEALKHSDMVKKFPHDKVISAGFVYGTFEEGDFACQGNSMSLGISAHKDDTEGL